MKIAYNPTTAAALTAAPSNNDITFDLKGVAIYVKGVKFKGTDTTYSVFKKHIASGNTGGYNGLVPVPSYTTTTVRFLREDGSWVTPTNTTYDVVSSTANGLAPKIGTAAAATIATQTDEWVLTSTKGGTPTWRKLPLNAFKNDNANTTYTLSGGLSGNNYIVTLTPSSGSATTATISAMTGATSSAAGKAGLVPVPAANLHTLFLKGDGTWATPANTHYTTHLYIGAKDAASNAATTNGNTYIKIADNSTIRNQYIIKGSGITVVASDANGNITINTPASHNLPTSDINKLTGYAIATSVASLTTTDTLNVALGKLEYKLNVAYDLVTKANDGDGTIENLKEILDVLSGISDTETIKGILGNYVTINTTLTITGLKTFLSNSSTTGVSLILKNKGWTGNMSTAMDFYNGGSYKVPNARIETKMAGDGKAGGTLIFYTQTKHASTNPNPNGLTERLRISDGGLTTVTGSLTVTSNCDFSTGTVKLDTLHVPTASGGSSYGAGTNGLVLKSNGTTVYWASDSNSDTKVTQTITTTNANYRVLFSANANDDTETTTARKAANLLYNPSTGTLTTTIFNGTATKVTCTATSSNNDRPIVGTNTSNLLYYTTKATVNWSTGLIKAVGFAKSGSSDSYVLLGGGGHKALSDFILKSEILTNNLTTISKSLTVKQAWMDTGIKNTDLPATGTYIILVYVHNTADSIWYNYWSGIMSWYKDGTNDSDADEILLHRAGHAYGHTIYLRTVMTANSDGRHLRLQIAADKDLTTAATYTFKFKRII